MTITEVRRRVKFIKHLSDINDYEAAHSKEDDLYEKFVKAIATGEYLSIDKVITIAREVIKTKNYLFDRYCA